MRTLPFSFSTIALWRAPLALTLVLGGCIPSPYGLALGEECELNSDCDAPLVCRIGYCRTECSTSRDCAAGLDCVQDNAGLGACQLPAETTCTNDSNCPLGLVCTMGECSNACGACTEPGPCRDCPPGAECVRDTDGMLGCFDPSMRSCVYSSECGFMGDEFVCAFDGRCRLECRTDCDCRNGEACRVRDFAGENVDGGVVSGLICVLPRADEAPNDCLPDTGVTLDAGVLDAAAADAPADDVPADEDAGDDDAGEPDAGTDAP